jgi:hypothetical protein
MWCFRDRPRIRRLIMPGPVEYGQGKQSLPLKRIAITNPKQMEGSELRLAIADDGVGFDPKMMHVNGSLGLVSVGERARFVHGLLSVESHAGNRIDNHGCRDGAPGLLPPRRLHSLAKRSKATNSVSTSSSGRRFKTTFSPRSS